MGHNNPRKWPCVDCKAPKTATRVGTRCPACQVTHARERDLARHARTRTDYDRHHARLAKARQMQAQRRREATAARQAALPVTDAVALYRAEKAKRDARDAAALTAALASAKALLERAA